MKVINGFLSHLFIGNFKLKVTDGKVWTCPASFTLQSRLSLSLTFRINPFNGRDEERHNINESISPSNGKTIDHQITQIFCLLCWLSGALYHF